MPAPEASTDREPSKWTMTWDVVRLAGLMPPRIVALLTGYYLLTPLSSAVEGMAWLMLVNIFTPAAGNKSNGGMALDFLSWLPAALMADTRSQIITAASLFLIKAVLTAALLSMEGTTQAVIRRTLQEHCIASVMRGRWEFLRRGNIGRWVGAATEESGIFANYFTMGARTLYALISFLILGLMAVLVNPRLTLMMMLVTLPAGLFLRFLYQRHAALSSRFAQARQLFSADATERLSGLFQIKAFGDLAPHLDAALASQDAFTRTEISLAYSNGLINAFSPLLLPVLLVAFSLWTAWHGRNVAAQIQVLGSVGILGYRAATQLSTVVASFGSLTSYSGCLSPVRDLCLIPEESVRELLPEPLAGVELKNVGYSFDRQQVIRDKSLTISSGRLYLITGESGGGKSTLANLISGLCEPNAGEINYIGASGKRYDSRRYRARIGYVTQDVFLFRGSVRRNLDPWGRLDDEALWRSLDQAGAAAFVRTIGGLDAEVAEAGRSLSGGERRRLAIASTLAQHADCLVLDEVTNGLDEAAKSDLVGTIAALSRRALVIAISHDLPAFDAVEKTVHAMTPRTA
ncbi:MAG: ABC transporter ATP-binding protein [Elusimicrobia bacterium]|nr:ABC transporter ATP-binding protein [Elusimicrobiota bacterium]MDE2511431.1 ABC transporter ATP-binding protein [Elusimicrobiota bacterium]